MQKPQKPRKKRKINPGDTFGFWKALESRPKGSRYVLCLCTRCNKTECKVDYMRLFNGAQSCGCIKEKDQKKNKVKIGDIYYCWRVLKIFDKKVRVQCVECESFEKDLSFQRLFFNSNDPKSCGCLKKKYQVEAEKNIGFWRPLESAKKGLDYVEAQCTGCNKTKRKIHISTLLGKGSSHCGCQFNMSVGSLHGCWKILEPLKSDRTAKSICTACNETVKDVEYSVLHRGISRSCGCLGDGSSIAELEILQWIKSLYPEAKKSVFDRRELDIFIPELNLGIEHNGLYWHSESLAGKKKHLDKTTFFKDKGIRTIHIWEHEWLSKQDQVKSFLLSALDKNENKIGARKCKFIWSDAPKDKKEVAKFLDKYHIQGKVGCRYVCKVIYKDELVAIATFGKHHRNSKDWVLSRFCTKTNYTIQGGLAKISKLASKELESDIISWAEYRLSLGNGYEKAGWQLEEHLPPDYFYFKGLKVFSKQSRMKSVVGTPKNMTEAEHAKLDGLERVWDCGKIRFRYRYD